MSVALQHRRGTTAQHAAFTGADGEITVDTTKKTAVVHDGVTPGGSPMQKESAQLSALAGMTPARSSFLASGQGFEHRNRVINGAFQFNQRAYVSGAATTAGQYVFDRFKVTGTGGVTFSTTANKTTVTIPSGQTLQQVIEGLGLQSGTYVLSWEGTAQGRIAGGSYGASGAVTAAIVGGTNTTIEFNAGTVANVQLELGSVASPFVYRMIETELAMCQRYYETGYAAAGTRATDNLAVMCAYFATTKRANPTMTYSPISGGAITTSATNLNSAEFSNNPGANGAGRTYWFANAEL